MNMPLDPQAKIKAQRGMLQNMPPPAVQDMTQDEEAPNQLSPDAVDAMTQTPTASDQHAALLGRFTTEQLQAALAARQAKQPKPNQAPGQNPFAQPPAPATPPASPGGAIPAMGGM